MTALGFAVLEDTISAFLSGPKRMEDMRSFANQVSRRLYGFLGEHLPSQQYERKFNAMSSFIADRTGRQVTADAIDDRTVLAFWENCCADQQSAGDFRGFRTVAINFLHLRAALKTAADRLAIDAAAPIGSSRDAGEIDPGDICGALEVVDGKRSLLAELSMPPANRLKTINKREGARLELVIEAGDAATMLPLTIVRAESFGAHQARIIQAVRKRHMTGPRVSVDTLVNERPLEDYRAVAADFNAIKAQIRKIRHALMFILFRNMRPEAFEIGFDLFPDVAGKIRNRINEPDTSFADNVVPLHPDGAIGRLLQRAVEGDPETMPEAELFKSARMAFAKVNRQGFEEEQVCAPGTMEAATACEPLIRLCREELDRFLVALERHFSVISAEQVFEEDCRRFRSAFAALYQETA